MVLIFAPSGGGANNIFYLTVVLVIVFYISLPDGGGAVDACVDWCRFSTLCWWFIHIFILCRCRFSLSAGGSDISSFDGGFITDSGASDVGADSSLSDNDSYILLSDVRANVSLVAGDTYIYLYLTVIQVFLCRMMV
jgi:hypothetical protein